LPWLLLFLLLATGVVAFALLGRPRLRFSNALAAPVRLTLAEKSTTVGPGETITVPAARGRTLVAQWELQRPLSADDKPMGEAVVGSFVLREPRGTVTRGATNREAGDYFAPLITNASNQILRVIVNAGLEGSLDCGCAVRPGTRRVFIGYYRLYQNSTVKVIAPSGATAMFQNLGPQVRNPDGSVGLRFEEKDLRPALSP
jgi:hypothetical protein